jgi:hypothetical protein
VKVGPCVLFTLLVCLFACGGVQHVLCCVFIRLVYPMLSVSLDIPFVIALSVFSDVHLSTSTTGHYIKTDICYQFVLE